MFQMQAHISDFTANSALSITAWVIKIQNKTICMQGTFMQDLSRVRVLAATKMVFLNICSFFPRATFLQFSRRVYLFVEQTCFFQEGLSSICSSNNFPGAPIFSSNRYLFSRKPPCLKHIDIFQEDTPRRTDILLIGLSKPFWKICVCSKNRYRDIDPPGKNMSVRRT